MKQELILKKKELPEGWRWSTISNEREVVTGGTPSRTNMDFYGGTIPWIKPSDLDKTIYVNTSEEYLSESGAKKSRLLPKGSILVSCIGNLGKLAIAGCELATNQQINSIIPGSNMDSKYIYYFLRFTQPLMYNKASTALVPILNKTLFSNLPLLVPPLPIQQKIVSKLDRQMAQIEMMKREAEREKKASNKLFKSFLNKIFNFKMKEELPSGWKWKNLTELVKYPKSDIVSGPFGSNLVVADYRNEGIPIIRLQNIQRGRFLNKDIKYVSPEKAEELKRHSYLPGDIVIAKLGVPIGKTCIVPENIEKGVVVADVVRVRINEEKNDVHFIEYLL